MSAIHTVTGNILPKDVTFCHCHEHLMISKGTSADINPALCIDNYDKTRNELLSFALAGGSTIVDAQPVGCNRVEQALFDLSVESGINIIASTGFHKRIFYPENHWIFRYDKETLTKIFLHELQSGMYTDCDTKVPRDVINSRAGIIKCALDICGLDPHYKKLFDAAAGAALLTGAPVMVHIESGSDPLMLADYLLGLGISPTRLIFCHMDRACRDLSMHRKLCHMGIYLEYDTIARPKYHDDHEEAAIFMDLLWHGYEDHLLFSLDTTRERLRTYHPGGPGLTYIINTFVPLLKSFGCNEEQILKISCLNCRKVLAISKLNTLSYAGSGITTDIKPDYASGPRT